jgi:hypothetical protein
VQRVPGAEAGRRGTVCRLRAGLALLAAVHLADRSYLPLPPEAAAEREERIRRYRRRAGRRQELFAGEECR